MEYGRDQLEALYDLIGSGVDDTRSYERLHPSGVVTHPDQLRPLYHWPAAVGRSICAGWQGGVLDAFWTRDEDVEPRTIHRVALAYSDEDRARAAATELWTWFSQAVNQSPKVTVEPGPDVSWGQEPRWSLIDRVRLSNGHLDRRVHLGWRHDSLVVNAMMSGGQEIEVEGLRQGLQLQHRLAQSE